MSDRQVLAISQCGGRYAWCALVLEIFFVGYLTMTESHLSDAEKQAKDDGEASRLMREANVRLRERAEKAEAKILALEEVLAKKDTVLEAWIEEAKEQLESLWCESEDEEGNIDGNVDDCHHCFLKKLKRESELSLSAHPSRSPEPKEGA